MPRRVYFETVTGEKKYYLARTGPPSSGFVKRLINIPPEHLAVLQFIVEETGGMTSVNQLVRSAIKFYITMGLCNPVYIGLLKH